MTIPQALQIALEHHRAGRMAEAETIYHQILAVQPTNADALHFLGVLAQQANRHAAAVEWIHRALACTPDHAVAHCSLGESYLALGQIDRAATAYACALRIKPEFPEAHFNLGNILRKQGRLSEAMAAYRNALLLKSNFPEALNNLGNALRDQGQPDEAIAAYRRSLDFKPDYAEAHNNLGNALKDGGHFDEAIGAYRNALRLKPDFPEAHDNLGEMLRKRRQFGEAIAAHRNALRLRSDFPEAYNNLGNALCDQGQLVEAIDAYRCAVRLKPDFPEAHSNMGVALLKQGRLEDAVGAYRHALQIKPGLSEALNNLAATLSRLGRLDESVTVYQQALQSKPNLPELHSNLGNVLRDLGELDRSIAACRRAIELKPDHAEAHNNLANAFKDGAQLDEAIPEYRHALRLAPSDASFHSNLVYALHFHSDYDTAKIGVEQQRWNLQFGEPVKPFILPHGNDRNPDRGLRIGYLSPDFRDQVVGRNVVPLFERHDGKAFEVFCYSGVSRPDRFTEIFQRHVQHWRNTEGVSDEALAEMIRQDGVDILVDLTQHMAGNRLPVFARKPAPVQVSFAGYPESTGLEAIEYRISDPHLEEGSGNEELEKRERTYLIDSFWCYDPNGMEVDVNALPASDSGTITFGSLGNFGKVNEPVLRLWARVLGAVPGSRVLIWSPEGSHRQRTLDIFQGKGVQSRRVDFVGSRPREEYLKLYQRLDIVLDTFPYNGHTTSLDALWMGVPVVSLAGLTAVSRAGVSQLTNLGLPELVARSESEFVNIAINLAGDLPRLAQLRSTLRHRMENSVLMDAARFTRNIEAAYRSMWERWCAGKG